MKQQVISKRAASLIFELGMVTAALKALASRKPVSSANSFEEYQQSLSPLESDEPAIAVKLNLTGSSSLTKEDDSKYAVVSPEGAVTTKISLLDIPQDDYVFLKGLHRGGFEIGQALPPYYFGMGIMHAQTLVEVYLQDLLDLVYEDKPELMSEQKFVTGYLQCLSNGDVNGASEVRQKAASRILRLPLPAIAKGLREHLGFTDLIPSIDESLMRSSLLRNCIAHGSIVSAQLAAAFPSEFHAGSALVPDRPMFDRALSSYRRFIFSLELARPEAIASRQQPAFPSRGRARS